VNEKLLVGVVDFDEGLQAGLDDPGGEMKDSNKGKEGPKEEKFELVRAEQRAILESPPQAILLAETENSRSLG